MKKSSHFPQPKRIQSLECRYVFVDIVGFSTRTVEAQASIVQSLNRIVLSAVKRIDLDIDEANDVICIPTGDGLCIAITASKLGIDAMLDIHLRLSCVLLSLIGHYNREQKDDERRFNVRIGLNENIDILIRDINGRKNVAGAGINDAARIMDLADANQVLVGQNVFNRLERRIRYRNVFRPYKAVVKHGMEMNVYQYAPEETPSLFELNRQQPIAIARAGRQQLLSELISTGGLLLEAIRALLARAENQVLLVAKQREWIYPLASSLVMARVRGLDIVMSHYPDSEKEVNRGQLRFLDSIGCTVVEQAVEKSVPLEGVFIDYRSKRIEGVACTDRPDEYGYFARKLHPRGDRPILNTLAEVLVNRELKSLKRTRAKLRIKTFSSKTAVTWLRRVPTYSNCDIRMEKVRVRDTRPIASEVLYFKLEQARALRELYRALRVEPFQALGVILKNTNISPIMPPVIEVHDGLLSVAEGHSRLYSSWLAGEDSVWCLIVRGVLKPPQKNPMFWREVRTDNERSRSAFANDPQAKINARDIENYVHQHLW
jgi:class 3 adenylate cyclase